MKKILSMVLVIVLVMGVMSTNVFATQNPFTVKVNGSEMKFQEKTIIEKGRSLVSINGDYSKIGATATYDKTTQEIVIDSKYTTITMKPNEKKALIHRKFDFTGIPQEVTLEASAKKVGNTYYVPFRFIAETLNFQVNWEAKTNTANITTVAMDEPARLNLVEFQSISIEEVKNDTIKNWYQANNQKQGVHYVKDNNTLYVLVSAGERPTAGYSVQVNEVVNTTPDSITVTYKVNKPASDMMVAQVITYPSALIKLDGTNIKTVEGTEEVARISTDRKQ